MTDIRFSCPQCNRHLVIDECGAGQQVSCPQCSQLIQIPHTVKPPYTAKIDQLLFSLANQLADGQTNHATARLNLKKGIQAAGYHPGTAGIEQDSPEDLLNEDRLNLLLDFNCQILQAYRNWQQCTNQSALKAWPAQELYPMAKQNEPYNWQDRWQQAGGILTSDQRMIALKNDQVWLAISDFGFPYPPFAIGSGMWVRDISSSEARDLGILSPGGLIDMPQGEFKPVLLSIQDRHVTEYLEKTLSPD